MMVLRSIVGLRQNVWGRASPDTLEELIGDCPWQCVIDVLTTTS